MRRNGPGTYWGTVTSGIVVVGLLGLLCFVPWKMDTLQRCAYCGAETSRVRIMLIPLPERITEGRLAHYWRRNVDTHHRHEWVAIASGYCRGLGSGVSDHSGGFHPRWMLKDEHAVAILSSLRTSTERKAFMKWLWESGTGKDARKVLDTAMELRAAYAENPKRKDWPQVLRKLGCYPDTGGKSP